MSYSEFENLLKKHKNNGWVGVGYHLFVSESNIISLGRPYNYSGAHTLGFNKKSIGICVYSKDGSICEQKIKLVLKLIEELISQFGNLKIISHTQGQVMYFNQILRDKNIRQLLSESSNFSKQEEYERVKNDVDELCLEIKRLSSDNSHVLKELNKFKYCPGKMFEYFVKK